METTKEELLLEVRQVVAEEVAKGKSELSEPEGVANLKEDYAKREGEVASLREENARLESPEYREEVVRDWGQKLDREAYLKLGELKGFLNDFPDAPEAEVAEVEEETGEVTEPVAEVSETKPELVWTDPNDPEHYSQHDVLPCWVLKPEEKVA